MSTSTKHDPRLDLLRTIAIFGTITIHTIHEVFARPDYVGGASWWVADILNTLARTSIPLFIMISGALLFDKLTDIKAAWLRTVPRLITPLIFWAFWYRFVDWYWFGKSFDIFGMWHMFLNGNVYVFYFLVLLAGIYLAQPFVCAATKSSTEPDKLILKISLASLIIGCVYSLFGFLFFKDASWWNAATLWMPYYGFFGLGYLIYNQSLKIKTWMALVSGLLGGFGILMGSYINVKMVGQENYLLWHNSGGGTQYFDEYLTPFAIILSCCVFSLILKLESKLFSGKFGQHINVFSQYSFGMYAVHSFVLQQIEHNLRFTTQGYSGSLLVFMGIKLSMAILGSLSLAWILSKVPLLSKISGTAVK